jgi:4-amino-4-deoxy-L-arabinose transferase-like glycosyltransferase/membrane-associated phospholipid phosphatase
MTYHAIEVKENSPGSKDASSQKPTRRYALYGLAILLGLVALIIWPFDRTISDALRLSGLNQNSLLLWCALQPLKLFGKGDILFLLGLVLAIHRRKQVAVAACLAMVIGGLIVAPMKPIVGRQRPDGRDARSFPSGDAAAVTAFVVPIATAFPATRPIAVAGVAAIGAARIAVGLHFPSDVLAGIAIGILAGAIVLSLKISLKLRIRRLLRRSWVAVALGLFVFIRLLMESGNDVRQFLPIFGPAVALLAIFPFIRARLRARRYPKVVPPRSRERMLALGLAVIIFTGLLFSTTRSTLWDRDEPRFSEATVEMIHSGDYLVPTFRGELRPDKPILIYWLMSLPVRIFGPTELACRFFAPIGAAMVCLLTYRLGWNLFGPGAGLIAMAILATTPLLLVTGTAATTDAVLLSTIVAAFVIFEAGLRNGLKKIHVVGLSLALGAALLTKGPVGLIIPVLGMIVILIFARRLSLTWGKYLVLSVLLAIGIFLAWAIPANEATGGEFMRRGIGYHVLERTTRPIDSHGGNFLLFLPFYIPVVVLAFFPWTLFLPAALSAVAGGRVGGKHGRSFLLGWALPTFIFMSLVSTKLPHYILPIWPAFSLAVAGMIIAAEQGMLTSRDLAWLKFGRWLFGIIGFLGGAVLVVGPWFVPAFGLSPPGGNPADPGLAWSMTGLGCVLLVMTFLALREQGAKRYRSTVGILVAGAVGLMFTIVVFGLPTVERFKVSKPLADAIRARTSEDVQVASLDYDEPSLIFYLGRRHLKSLGNDAGVVNWTKELKPGVLVISRKALSRIESESGSLGLKEIGSVRGFNYSNGKWVELVALVRKLPYR